jgi:hypothetical protein
MRKSNWPFFTKSPSFKQDFFQKTLDRGFELHGINGLGIAGEVQVIHYYLTSRMSYGNLRWGRRGKDIALAAGEDGQGQTDEQEIASGSLRAGISGPMEGSLNSSKEEDSQEHDLGLQVNSQHRLASQ